MTVMYRVVSVSQKAAGLVLAYELNNVISNMGGSFFISLAPKMGLRKYVWAGDFVCKIGNFYNVKYLQ